MPQWYEPGMIFMQDNAPIHKAKKILDWLELHGVETTEWPPFSPDLNPIEHVWSWMNVTVWTFEVVLRTRGCLEKETPSERLWLLEMWQPRLLSRDLRMEQTSRL